jgi:D-arabinose 1-dehydrogenase-like Zn-dependent alcohol dehydrogenase
VRPVIETYSMAEAPKGYERMLSGQARFRVVLTNS